MEKDEDFPLGVRIWAAAQALVGVPFRLHGRDITGLDCVGLVALSLAQAGIGLAAVPQSYRLRGTDQAAAQGMLRDAGFVAVDDDVAVGDVLLITPAPDQLHLAIIGRGDDGDWRAIHAHASLRRVVEMPGYPAGVILSRWRMA